MALNDTQIRAAKWDGKDYTLNDGNGLYLNVRRSSKTWIIRRKRDGKMRVTTLGKYPDVGLKTARKKTIETDRKRHPSAVTVAQLADEYREIINRDNKRPKTTLAYLDRGLPSSLLKTRVSDVLRTELVDTIKAYPISRTGCSGERARDAFRIILRQMFDLAVENGYRDDNPADKITAHTTGYKQVNRERVLSDNEIKALWNETHHNARVLRFLLLTGVRIGEAHLAKPWATRGRIWRIPGEYSKNGDPHWVYLTDAAQQQARHPFDRTMTAVQAWTKRWCQRNEFEPPFTPHDIRRTVATRLNDAGIAPHIVEKMLNHRLQGVMRVYNKAQYEDERIEGYKTLEHLVLEVVA